MPNQPHHSNPVRSSPGFLDLHRSGELRRRSSALGECLKSCKLCPRECGIDRLSGYRGTCNAPCAPQVSAFYPHVDPHDPISGPAGSGMILFTHCSLRCAHCVSSDISQNGDGTTCSTDDLADIMLILQNMGCANINLVTPAHYVPFILDSLDVAARAGLRIPIVYSTGGWERIETLRYLDGVVDIYATDFKYASGAIAGRLSSGARSYPDRVRIAIREMHRQRGETRLNADGTMISGLIIQHLVLPNGVSGTKEVLAWIANNLPRDSRVRLLSNYRPAHDAFRYLEIWRETTREEHADAITWARELGLNIIDIL